MQRPFFPLQSFLRQTYSLINDDYVWSDGTNTPKVINWTIEKALINLDNISFENGTFIYNGKEKNLYISGALPKGVRVEYDNNGQIQPGVYTITSQFIIIDTDNYTFEGELAELTAILTIKPTEKKSGCSSSLNYMAIIISWLSLMAILSIKKF